VSISPRDPGSVVRPTRASSVPSPGRSAAPAGGPGPAWWSPASCGRSADARGRSRSRGMGAGASRARRRGVAEDRRAGWLRPIVADLVPSRRRGPVLLRPTDTPKLRDIAHQPRVSFHLRSDPDGDHSLSSEGTAAIDATIPPLDPHERYRAKHREPHARWGMDFTQTARDSSVPIWIGPTCRAGSTQPAGVDAQ